MSETHSVKRHLDVDADAYDVQIRRFIPHYDDMLATGVEVLAALTAPTARVLEDRVTFHEGSFLAPLPPADAVVASLALHHVHALEQKTELYGAIHAALAPGGVFLNLDAAITEELRLSSLIFDRWAAHLGKHGISDAQARGHFAAWADEDRYFPLDAELTALRRAGFAEVECFWRRGPSAICCGLRASGPSTTPPAS